MRVQERRRGLVIPATFVLQLPLNTDSTWLSALAVLGAAVGVYLFFYGFRMLQYKRLILNTPFSKIRSASIGLVEVSGTPTGPKTITAGITGTPCYYYRARGWQWRESGKGGSWQQVVDESLSVPFFLEDSTGKVLVNPQGASLDVHRSFYDEVYTMSALGANSLVPESIRKFIAIRGLVAGEKVRLEEHIIQPGFPLFVFGTLGENRLLNSWNAQPHVSGKKMSISFGPGNSINLQFKRDVSVSGVAAKALSGLLQSSVKANTQSSTYISRPDGGSVELSHDVVKTLQQAGVNAPFPVVAGSGKMTVSSRTLADGLLRTNSMQVAIAANPSAAIDEQQQAGTDPNQSAGNFDMRAPVAIGKGERGEPFTISWQSQREVVQSLGWKAVGCIWGGPIFALICLYSLLAMWGWM